MSRLLTQQQVKEKYPTIYEIFYSCELSGISLPSNNARLPTESLHDYFMRKGFKCFCRDCRQLKIL